HHRPVLYILHPGQLAESLHDGIVVHEDYSVVIADPRQRLAQSLRQIETLRLPVAWQVLATALDRAVGANHARTANADERRQRQPILVGSLDEIEQERDQLFHCILALWRVVAVPPELQAMDAGVGQITLLLLVELDDPRADVTAADVDRKDAVMASEHPRGNQMDAANESRVIGGMTNRVQVDRVAAPLQGDAGATDGELADAALTQTAADDDALDILPFLQAQEAADHRGKLLRKFLDGAVNHAGGLGIAFQEEFVELLLADLFAGLFAQRILAHLADAFAPIIEDRLKRA